MENTISIPRGASYSCPHCGKHTVRKQKSGLAKVRYRCYSCYWAGDIPNVERKFVTRNKSVVNSVSYEDIIKNLLYGKSISEQYQVFGVALGSHMTNGRNGAIRNKILRVYNCYSEYTKIPCNDVDFVKIRYTPDVMALLISAIEDEERKIRNSPRLSVTYSK